MANKWQMQILMKGVNAWNTWRRECDRQELNLFLDLRGADLRGAKLEGIDLSFAYLVGADLRGADLYQANLRQAYLKGANLSGADLHRADLHGAHLRGANLEGAKLPINFKPPVDPKPEEPKLPSEASKSAAKKAYKAARRESTDAHRSQNSASSARGSETLVAHDTLEDVFSVLDVQPTELGQTKEASETPLLVSDDTSSQVMRPTSVADDYLEGGEKERLSRYFERDPRLRTAAIALHGTTCMVCGFDFEATYGVHGAGYVEVHHLRPVSSLQAKTKVNPRTDMVVLCANCHRMIHRDRDKMLRPDELRSLLMQ